MDDRPTITDPKPGTKLDYSKEVITIRWNDGGGPHVKKWWLSVGSQEGRWDIRNGDKQKDQTETIPVDELPQTGKIYAQVLGKVNGSDDKGTPISHDEEISSDTVWWMAP